MNIRQRSHTHLLLLGAAFVTLMLGGCGSPGSPQPPSLKIPTPVLDLSAGRTGNGVSLHWTMPRRATDRVLLAGDLRVEICRSLEGASCIRIGQLLLEAGKPGAYTDRLPEALSTGAPRLLTYTVLLENHSRHNGGASNPAYTAAGSAPPEVTGVSVKAELRGIVLQWKPLPQSQPVAASTAQGTQALRLVRLQRTRVLASGESMRLSSEENQSGVPQPVDQTLEVAEPAPAMPRVKQPETLLDGWGLDHAIDADAALNRTYRYTVQQVARLSRAGHAFEVSSVPTRAVTVEARDVFPPAAPEGLQAVADAEGDAIDLSWTPNGEADVAGYFVYRRVEADGGSGAQGAPEKVSGKAPVIDAAWRDAAAAAGVRCAYSVSAVDTSGNESARSPEVEESVIPVPADQKPAPRPKPAGPVSGAQVSPHSQK